MSDEPFSFDEPLEWLLVGDAEAATAVLMRVGEELVWEGHTFRVHPVRPKAALPFLRVIVLTPDGQRGGVIGLVLVDSLPRGRSRVRVQASRGDSDPAAFDFDRDGKFFSAFLRASLEELKVYGFLSTPSRFKSHNVLATATRELDAAEEPEAISL